MIAYDVGRAVNPMTLDGQLVGGSIQGIGGALLEEFTYDENGAPLAVTFADYLMPAVHETLARLIERGLAACLERRPGQKEDRYTQLLGEDAAEELPAGIRVVATPVDGLEERVARLERAVAELRVTAQP